MDVKSRVRHLLLIVLVMAATLLAVGWMMEDPDYSTAIFAGAIGLVIGEIIHYMRKKDRPKP
ncbi:hypothetical protein [Bhargavaea beijingensis]|uniref:Uncharacterized protein n=1 Tax=Bhargavaea beijingensis TaxID=426756 RepID=A0A1G7E7E4_9BACL|nr:hypothetical protein [Bhargavaea beijingensis]MCW1927535.1 hypothetical protein [Bhargavaea beijingensis]SDE59539.1 hypothetical protein SAMN04488126_11294 [Bhargavaea beijingensis]